MVAGSTAKVWQDRWAKSFEQTIEARFDTLQRRAAEGALDFGEADAFLMTYRRDLEPRWQAQIGSAGAGQVKRLGETYLFECTTVDEAACSAVFDAVSSRLARPLTRERFISSEARAQSFGVVSVSIQISETRTYEYANEPTRAAAYVLPGVMEVGISIETHQRHSTWEGVKHFRAQIAPPVAVPVAEQRIAEERHYRALFDAIATQVQAIDRQIIQ